MMSAGKSLRASTDRDLVRSAAFDDIFTHAQVSTEIATSAGDVRLQVDLAEPASSESDARHQPAETAPRITKRFRVNGVPRRASDFVGVLKAVLFSAEDLEFTSGPPSVRRRYADMLVSQLDSGYVREAQEYQRVMTQRNHLLKSIREGRSSESELEFWDVQLSIHAARIMECRAGAISALSAATCPIHETMSGSGEPLSVTYMPSVEPGEHSDAPESVQNGARGYPGRAPARSGRRSLHCRATQRRCNGVHRRNGHPRLRFEGPVAHGCVGNEARRGGSDRGKVRRAARRAPR